MVAYLPPLTPEEKIKGHNERVRLAEERIRLLETAHSNSELTGKEKEALDALNKAGKPLVIYRVARRGDGSPPTISSYFLRLSRRELKIEDTGPNRRSRILRSRSKY